MVDPQCLATALDGARLAGVLPYLESELDRMEAAVDLRAVQLLEKDSLGAEKALVAWQEKAILRRIRRKFRQLVAVGEAAGAEIAPEMREI